MKLFSSGKVLLFSGGLDSYIAGKLCKPDIYLYLDIGSKYAKKEINNLKTLDIPLDKLIICNILDLSKVELVNNIVPLRNLFFSLIGLYYGNEILLAATKGDTTRDKDDTFRKLFNGVTDHLITKELDNKTFPWKSKKIIPRLVLPIKHLTKTQLVSEYLELGFRPEGIWQTISCYNSSKRECGNCKTCFRKAVALINNDIYKSSLFSQEIDWNFFIKQTISKKRKGELEDTFKAMKKINVRI